MQEHEEPQFSNSADQYLLHKPQEYAPVFPYEN